MRALPLRIFLCCLAIVCFGLNGASAESQNLPQVTYVATPTTFDYGAPNFNQREELPWYYFSEVRTGAGVTDPDTGHETSANIEGEALLQPIGDADWFYLLRPKPHFGVNFNVQGKTSFVYAGFTWELLRLDPLYLNFAFGAAVHNGKLHDPSGTRKSLGSREEFHESVEAGYDFDPHYGISIYIDHLSNAGWLSKINQGIETSGVRAVFRF